MKVRLTPNWSPIGDVGHNHLEVADVLDAAGTEIIRRDRGDRRRYAAERRILLRRGDDDLRHIGRVSGAVLGITRCRHQHGGERSEANWTKPM